MTSIQPLCFIAEKTEVLGSQSHSQLVTELGPDLSLMIPGR